MITKRTPFPLMFLIDFSQAVKDFRLFSFVASLILVDVLLIVLWETFDPLQAKEKHGLEQVRKY